MALRHFDEAVASVTAQTDPNWVLVIVDDHTEREKPLARLREVEAAWARVGRCSIPTGRSAPG